MAKQVNNTITKADVRHIAQLANLSLSDEEITKFTGQLAKTVSYIAMLEEVDTKNVEPTSNVTGLTSVTQPDQIRPSLPQEEVFKNARQHQPGFFKVKAVFE